MSFEEFISLPDSVLHKQQSIENAEKFSIQLNEEIEENIEHSEDQYLTPRQKIKLNKASESDRTTAVLRYFSTCSSIKLLVCLSII